MGFFCVFFVLFFKSLKAVSANHTLSLSSHITQGRFLTVRSEFPHLYKREPPGIPWWSSG